MTKGKKTESRSIVVSMGRDKITKGTYRYSQATEDGERPKIGSLYILKSEFEGEGPESVKVSVEY